MRKLYWAYLAHLKEGQIVMCDYRRLNRRGMIRVRLEVVKAKKRKGKK